MIDFDKIINNYLKRASYPRTPGRYYPSESGSCMRKTWYGYNMPREMDIDLIKLFEAGNLIHAFFTEVIKSDKNPEIALLSAETPIFLSYNDFIISGRMDNVALVRIDSKVYILEVKSVSDIRYSEEAKKPHISQLQLYMHSTGIHDGIIVYIERDSLKTKSFHVSYDSEIVKEALERFGKLHSYLKNKQLPEPEARLNKKELGWQCAKCQYHEECFASNPATTTLP